MIKNNECIFCKIAAKTMSANIIFEDDLIVAFTDIAPKAPVHILIVPKKHIQTIDDITKIDQTLIGHMVLIAQQIARSKQISNSGYRLVFNVRHHAGQVVDHIHLHILGGKKLGEMV